jgi:NADP-dependent 3-hydroxy acid dehydrogenase YdfG/acyl carrier protein
VVSGREEAIQELCRRLTGAEIEHRRVQIEVAAHSWMVEAILDKYDECVSRVRKQAPSKRYISNVSGKWITPEEATDAGYWRRQLRECVRFSDGVKELAAAGAEVIVEVGPGQTLRSLVKTQEIGKQIDWVVGTLRRPQEEQDDREYLIGAVGKLWMAGVEIDWGQYYEGEKRRRVGLPTYPFDRQRYWIEAGRSVEQSRRRKSSAKRQKVSEWFYLPEWRRKDLRRGGEQAAKGEGQRTNGKHYLVMEGSSSLSRGVVEGLNRNAAAVIRVKAGEIYRKIGALEYEIRAEEKTDYQKLLKALVDAGIEIEEVVHLWSIEDEEESQKEVNDEERFKSGQQKGFYSLLYMAQAIEACELTGVIQVSFVSRGLQDVESGDVVAIEQATALGACKVIAQECEKLNCRSIDVGEAPAGRQATRLVEALIDEIEHEGAGQEVAYRGRRRFVKSYEALRVEKKMPDLGLKEGGVYLITGGTGGIGVEVAEHLCKQRQGRVALVSRKGLAGVEAAIARRIERMEEKVMVARADVANEAEMRRAVAEVEQKFGRIDGVIHMAGLAGEKAVKIIPDVTHKDCEMHFNAKVYGLYVLDRILRDCRPDFCLLFSSNASILGGIGSICYSAANIFMDAFAFKRNRHSDTRWISANWDGWLLNESNRLSASFQTSLDQYAMTRDESIEALEYLLAPEMEGQVIVSTGDLMSRLAIWTRPKTNKTSDAGIDAAAFLSMHSRPSLGVEYTPASNEIEQVIINVWQEVLGIDRLGARDNFFDLGGNSLTGLKVISRLKKELKIDIPVVALFEGPTASDLARVISKGDAQGPADQESRVRGERRRERIRFKHSASDEIETADLS